MNIYDHLDQLSDREVRKLLANLNDLIARSKKNRLKVIAELAQRGGNSEVVWTPQGPVLE